MDYSVNRVSEGIDALATTRVAIRPDGRMASEGFVTSYKVLQVSGLRSTLLPGHCWLAMSLTGAASACRAARAARSCRESSPLAVSCPQGVAWSMQIDAGDHAGPQATTELHWHWHR